MNLRSALVVGLILVGFTGDELHAQQEAAERALKISSSELARWIDQRFAQRWRSAGLEAPSVVDDATFMRRVYLDLVGAIPAVPHVRDFLYATAPYKREELIERLLRDDRRPERFASRSAEHFARVWRRGMIPSSSPNAAIGTQFEPWLQEQFAANVPYDEFTRKLITAVPTPDVGPVAPGNPVPNPVQVFYQATGGTPASGADAVARYFLGVRLGCAQCHAHPFSDWKETDFWGLAAFFTDGEPGQIPQVKSENGTPYPAKLFWSDQLLIPDDTLPRQVLAEWLVSPDNPNFASTAVNRIWQRLCGRALVSPVEELDLFPEEEREMLDELGWMFAESGYDVKWLIEGICKSNYYQRASLSEKDGADQSADLRPLKSLTPEQLFDSLEESLALPVGRVDNPPRYNGLRAAFVNRMDEAAGESPEDFQAGIPQALMIMNGKLTADATSLEKSRTLRAVVDAPFLGPTDKIEALFLATLTRLPSANELDFLLKHVESQPNEHWRERAYSEVFWGLLNSPEFVLCR